MDTKPPDKPTDQSGHVHSYDGIRKIIGNGIHHSLQHQAQLTLTSSADAGQIIFLKTAFAQNHTLPRLTVLDFIVWAVAKNLKFFPHINSCFHVPTGRVVQFVLPSIGIAFDTPDGLKIPVLENTHRFPLFTLAEHIHNLQIACETSYVPPQHFEAGTCTIYHLDSNAVDTFTPISQYPQATSLGFSEINKPESRISLSLSINAQILSEYEGATFLRDVVDSLENVSSELASRGADESLYC